MFVFLCLQQHVQITDVLKKTQILIPTWGLCFTILMKGFQCLCNTRVSIPRRKKKQQTSLRNLCRHLKAARKAEWRRLFVAASWIQLKVRTAGRRGFVSVSDGDSHFLFFANYTALTYVAFKVVLSKYFPNIDRVIHLWLRADGLLLVCHRTHSRWNWDVVICGDFLRVAHMLLFINALSLLVVFIFIPEEEEAEVKKSKFYQPATKLVSVSPHVAAVSSSENRKSVSLCSLSVTCHVGR